MSTGHTMPPRLSISAGTRWRRFSARRKGKMEKRELGPVIESLEEEMRGLDDAYDLVLQREVQGGAAPNRAEDAGDASRILAKMKQKGEQLRKLRQYVSGTFE